ncbi:MAG: hypothetical protein ACLQPD_34400 [Desulfomonilaceae bacterium]
MKRTLAAGIIFFSLVILAEAQESFTAHGSTALYSPPDSSNWFIVKNGIDERSQKYLLMFQRKPIEDAQGRRVHPVIAIICEPIKEPLDVIKYSIAARVQVPFNVKKVLSHQEGDFSYSNVIGYEGEYEKEVLHKVLIGHLRHEQVGVQIICDSSDGVYDRVEADMRSFMRSVKFK